MNLNTENTTDNNDNNGNTGEQAPQLKDLFAEFNEISEQEATAAKAAKAQLAIEQKTKEVALSPIGQLIIAIKVAIGNEMVKTHGAHPSVQERKEQGSCEFGYLLRLSIGQACIEVDIAKDYNTFGRYHRKEGAPIGLKITSEFFDGQGYSSDHKSKSEYRVKLDGTWNSKGFNKKLSEKINIFKGIVVDKEQALVDHANKTQLKETIHAELQTAMGVELKPESEMVRDYSSRVGHGYDSHYAMVEDTTILKFSHKYVGKNGKEAQLAFVLNRDAENTVSRLTISANTTMTKEQLAQVIALIKTF